MSLDRAWTRPHERIAPRPHSARRGQARVPGKARHPGRSSTRPGVADRRASLLVGGHVRGTDRRTGVLEQTAGRPRNTERWEYPPVKPVVTGDPPRKYQPGCQNEEQRVDAHSTGKQVVGVHEPAEEGCHASEQPKDQPHADEELTR